MPTFAADLLPDASGRNLGNSSQLWTANLQNLQVWGTTAFFPVAGESFLPVGVIAAQSDPVTANANSTAYQSLMSAVVKGGSVNLKNKVVTVHAGGNWQLQTGQAPNMTLLVQFGGLIVYSGQVAVSYVGQPIAWNIRVITLVNTAGTSGVLVSTGVATVQQPGAATVLPYATQPTVSPLDLTRDFTILVFGSFSTNTSPANILTQQLMVVTKGN